MSALLEVVVTHAADATRAEAGGADRVCLLGDPLTGTEREAGALSPAPDLVAAVRAATSLPVRPLLRLRDGYGTDGGEVAHLHGLLAAYASAGADGVVMGFLNALTEIDLEVVAELLGGGGDVRWTFSRAVDACISTDRAWRELPHLPGLDAVATAGSARGVAEGLDELVARAEDDPAARRLIMAAGGLAPEHVPWLVRAGVGMFQVSTQVRPLGSWKAYVDADLVGTWRALLDSEAGGRPGAR
ncbi:copper homeostasis protein CutC [Microlunatus flavus]|uniref:Copper homeostasis protein cutC homolog n=1 Tax=Microlunatus flavus TaxID=1036181 RepID=A0A1H9MGK6_9ACTN|nr:copper homeostasis protein CutC [Microlunatus flavus]SER22812.1 copper homeostasis protein [Microlunatus flavus]